MQRAIYGVPFKFDIATLIAIAIGIFLGLAGAQAAEPFNWDRYHARQDACRQHEELVWRCSSIGAPGDHDGCETALRQTDRECSAFGPWGATLGTGSDMRSRGIPAVCHQFVTLL